MDEEALTLTSLVGADLYRLRHRSLRPSVASMHSLGQVLYCPTVVPLSPDRQPVRGRVRPCTIARWSDGGRGHRAVTGAQGRPITTVPPAREVATALSLATVTSDGAWRQIVDRAVTNGAPAVPNVARRIKSGSQEHQSTRRPVASFSE